MDPNHLPSSPLQHHRHSTSRPDNASPQERPTSSGDTSNKLTLPAPSNSSTANPSVNTLTPQWQPQEVDMSAMPTYAEPSGVVFDTPSQWDNNAIAGPSSQPWEQPLSHPLGATSRCPTPAAPPNIELSPADPPSSSLLTSEPLNRSVSSTSNTPFLPFAASPIPTQSATAPTAERAKSASPSKLGKRSRSASLPLVVPDLKRHKHRHGLPTPSDPWTWMLREPKRDRTKLERAEDAAVGLRAELEAVRGPRSATSVIIASRGPPINLSTLKSLDANEILKNPQLRHDLLFDSLAFRSVSLAQTAAYVEDSFIPPGVDPTGDPRAMSAVADMYWDSIADEITNGCRCSRWRVNGVEGRIDSAALVAKSKEKDCMCGGWRYDKTEAAWWAWQGSKWHSRLPELIKTLREILVSLMGSTTPCPSHFAHSFSREALAAHEATCPTITHALVPELYNALDPEFVTIQVRRKVFGLDIFHTLGEAMKVHCAPVRDAMVDDMVNTALSGDVAGGLRKCFDCVEVMKLDIANHQVHALRPYLWKSAAQHELIAFRAALTTFGLDLADSRTQRWIRAASLRVLRDTTPRQRAKLIENRPELVIGAVAEGFVDIVCGQWTTAGGSFPPVIQRRLTGSAGIQLAENAPAASVAIPESFRMDSRRIKNANAEMVDLALTHMCVTVFKSLLIRVRPDLPAYQIKTFMAEARRDVEYAFDMAAAAGTGLTQSELLGDLAFRLAKKVYQPDFALGQAPHIASKEELAEVDLLARTFTNFFAAQFRPDGSAYIKALNAVRQGVTVVLGHRLLYNQWDPIRSSSSEAGGETEMEVDDISPGRRPLPAVAERERHGADLARAKEAELEVMEKHGMGYLREEIKGLVEKVEPIVAFNLRVFMEIYGEAGMVVGS